LKEWNARQLIFVDESAANERTQDRKYGWAPIGKAPIEERPQSVLNVGLSFQHTQSKDTLHGILFMDHIPQNYFNEFIETQKSSIMQSIP
jgi:hypothetical protein